MNHKSKLDNLTRAKIIIGAGIIAISVIGIFTILIGKEMSTETQILAGLLGMYIGKRVGD